MAALALILVLLTGCAASHASMKPVTVPVLVVPSCQVPNAFEYCKGYCMAKAHQRVTSATETDTTVDCGCVPFDT